MSMTVKEIVKQYLTEHDYDGVCCEYCGCGIEDLADFCEGRCSDCEPAYRITLTEELKPILDPEGEFDVGDDIFMTEKPEKR